MEQNINKNEKASTNAKGFKVDTLCPEQNSTYEKVGVFNADENIDKTIVNSFADLLNLTNIRKVSLKADRCDNKLKFLYDMEQHNTYNKKDSTKSSYPVDTQAQQRENSMEAEGLEENLFLKDLNNFFPMHRGDEYVSETSKEFEDGSVEEDFFPKHHTVYKRCQDIIDEIKNEDSLEYMWNSRQIITIAGIKIHRFEHEISLPAVKVPLPNPNNIFEAIEYHEDKEILEEYISKRCKIVNNQVFTTEGHKFVLVTDGYKYRPMVKSVNYNIKDKITLKGCKLDDTYQMTATLDSNLDDTYFEWKKSIIMDLKFNKDSKLSVSIDHINANTGIYKRTYKITVNNRPVYLTSVYDNGCVRALWDYLGIVGVVDKVVSINTERFEELGIINLESLKKNIDSFKKNARRFMITKMPNGDHYHCFIVDMDEYYPNIVVDNFDRTSIEVKYPEYINLGMIKKANGKYTHVKNYEYGSLVYFYNMTKNKPWDIKTTLKKNKMTFDGYDHRGWPYKFEIARVHYQDIEDFNVAEIDMNDYVNIYLDLIALPINRLPTDPTQAWTMIMKDFPILDIHKLPWKLPQGAYIVSLNENNVDRLIILYHKTFAGIPAGAFHQLKSYKYTGMTPALRGALRHSLAPRDLNQSYLKSLLERDPEMYILREAFEKIREGLDVRTTHAFVKYMNGKKSVKVEQPNQEIIMQESFDDTKSYHEEYTEWRDSIVNNAEKKHLEEGFKEEKKQDEIRVQNKLRGLVGPAEEKQKGVNIMEMVDSDEDEEDNWLNAKVGMLKPKRRYNPDLTSKTLRVRKSRPKPEDTNIPGEILNISVFKNPIRTSTEENALADDICDIIKDTDELLIPMNVVQRQLSIKDPSIPQREMSIDLKLLERVANKIDIPKPVALFNDPKEDNFVLMSKTDLKTFIQNPRDVIRDLPTFIFSEEKDAFIYRKPNEHKQIGEYYDSPIIKQKLLDSSNNDMMFYKTTLFLNSIRVGHEQGWLSSESKGAAKILLCMAILYREHNAFAAEFYKRTSIHMFDIMFKYLVDCYGSDDVYTLARLFGLIHSNGLIVRNTLIFTNSYVHFYRGLESAIIMEEIRTKPSFDLLNPPVNMMAPHYFRGQIKMECITAAAYMSSLNLPTIEEYKDIEYNWESIKKEQVGAMRRNNGKGQNRGGNYGGQRNNGYGNKQWTRNDYEDPDGNPREDYQPRQNNYNNREPRIDYVPKPKNTNTTRNETFVRSESSIEEEIPPNTNRLHIGERIETKAPQLIIRKSKFTPQEEDKFIEGATSSPYGNMLKRVHKSSIYIKGKLLGTSGGWLSSPGEEDVCFWFCLGIGAMIKDGQNKSVLDALVDNDYETANAYGKSTYAANEPTQRFEGMPTVGIVTDYLLKYNLAVDPSKEPVAGQIMIYKPLKFDTYHTYVYVGGFSSEEREVVLPNDTKSLAGLAKKCFVETQVLQNLSREYRIAKSGLRTDTYDPLEMIYMMESTNMAGEIYDEHGRIARTHHEKCNTFKFLLENSTYTQITDVQAKKLRGEEDDKTIDPKNLSLKSQSKIGLPSTSIIRHPYADTRNIYEELTRMEPLLVSYGDSKTANIYYNNGLNNPGNRGVMRSSVKSIFINQYWHQESVMELCEELCHTIYVLDYGPVMGTAEVLDGATFDGKVVEKDGVQKVYEELHFDVQLYKTSVVLRRVIGNLSLDVKKYVRKLGANEKRVLDILANAKFFCMAQLASNRVQLTAENITSTSMINKAVVYINQRMVGPGQNYLIEEENLIRTTAIECLNEYYHKQEQEKQDLLDKNRGPVSWYPSQNSEKSMAMTCWRLMSVAHVLSSSLRPYGYGKIMSVSSIFAMMIASNKYVGINVKRDTQKPLIFGILKDVAIYATSYVISNKIMSSISDSWVGVKHLLSHVLEPLMCLGLNAALEKQTKTMFDNTLKKEYRINLEYMCGYPVVTDHEDSYVGRLGLSNSGLAVFPNKSLNLQLLFKRVSEYTESDILEKCRENNKVGGMLFRPPNVPYCEDTDYIPYVYKGPIGEPNMYCKDLKCYLRNGKECQLQELVETESNEIINTPIYKNTGLELYPYDEAAKLKSAIHCQQNFFEGLFNRHFAPLKAPAQWALTSLRNFVEEKVNFKEYKRHLLDVISENPDPYKYINDKYSGIKRQIYINSLETIERDSKVKYAAFPFLKIKEFQVDKTKDPRSRIVWNTMDQSKGIFIYLNSMLIEASRRSFPWYHIGYNMDEMEEHFNDTPNFEGGLLSGDWSAWDAHHNFQIKQITNAPFYDLLEELIGFIDYPIIVLQQAVNIMRTDITPCYARYPGTNQLMMKFKTQGTTISGKFYDTTDGNTKSNGLIIAWLADRNGVQLWINRDDPKTMHRHYTSGDDFLLQSPNFPFLDATEDEEDGGLGLKLKTVTYSRNTADYLSKMIKKTPLGFAMSRPFSRVIGTGNLNDTELSHAEHRTLVTLSIIQSTVIDYRVDAYVAARDRVGDRVITKNMLEHLKHYKFRSKIHKHGNLLAATHAHNDKKMEGYILLPLENPHIREDILRKKVGQLEKKGGDLSRIKFCTNKNPMSGGEGKILKSTDKSKRFKYADTKADLKKIKEKYQPKTYQEAVEMLQEGGDFNKEIQHTVNKHKGRGKLKVLQQELGDKLLKQVYKGNDLTYKYDYIEAMLSDDLWSTAASLGMKVAPYLKNLAVTYGPQAIEWLYSKAKEKFNQTTGKGGDLTRVGTGHGSGTGFTMMVPPITKNNQSHGLYTMTDANTVDRLFIASTLCPEFYSGLCPDGMTSLLASASLTTQYNIVSDAGGNVLEVYNDDQAFSNGTEFAWWRQIGLTGLSPTTGVSTTFSLNPGIFFSNIANTTKFRVTAAVKRFVPSLSALTTQGIVRVGIFDTTPSALLAGGQVAISAAQCANAGYFKSVPIYGLKEVRMIHPCHSYADLSLDVPAVNNVTMDSDVTAFQCVGAAVGNIGTMYVTVNIDYQPSATLNGMVKVQPTPDAPATMSVISTILKRQPHLIFLGCDESRELADFVMSLKSDSYSEVANEIIGYASKYKPHINSTVEAGSAPGIVSMSDIDI